MPDTTRNTASLDYQFRCPRCGNVTDFEADAVILSNARVLISPDGWDYFTNGADVDLTEHARLTCGNQSCQYSALASEFYI